MNTECIFISFCFIQVTLSIIIISLQIKKLTNYSIIVRHQNLQNRYFPRSRRDQNCVIRILMHGVFQI